MAKIIVINPMTYMMANKAANIEEIEKVLSDTLGTATKIQLVQEKKEDYFARKMLDGL